MQKLETMMCIAQHKWDALIMFLFLQCIKGEAGESGIPGLDGREGHPVSDKHRQ